MVHQIASIGFWAELEHIHKIELIIILVLVIIQINIGSRLWIKIKRLKDLNLHDTLLTKVTYPLKLMLEFDYEVFSKLIEKAAGKYYHPEDNNYDEEEEEEEEEEIFGSDHSISTMLLYTDTDINDTRKIVKELNIYMLKNDQNLINFNVVRDIVDRNYQVLDDDINQLLPTPLYMGLAATMLGIIFGLWGMITGDAEVGSGIGTGNIGSLLVGVGLAMISSLIGLLITTILSTLIYKNSKRESDEEKNSFYSMLQANLLPELLRRGETGIEALNKRLERFGKVSADSVEHLTEITRSVSANLMSQSRLIERVEQLDVQKLSKSTMEIFEKLENNLKSFEKFSAYWDKINSSIGATNSLIGNLKILDERFESVETISNTIHSTLLDYNNTMAFFTSHIEEIKASNGLTLKALTNADVAFSKSIDVLRENMQNRIGEIDGMGTILDVKLNDIGSEVAESLENATKEHIRSLLEAYNQSIPRFDKLENLDNLHVINENISHSHTSSIEHNSRLVNELISNFTGIENSINDLKKSLSNFGINSAITPGTYHNSKNGKIEFILKIVAMGVIIVSGALYLTQVILDKFQ